MSWNIEKPGDRINGPLTITGNTTLTGTATISGDLTVDTNTLKVDATNNRVGIGTASPGRALDVVGNSQVSGYAKAGQFSVAAGPLAAFDASSGGLYNYYSSGGVIAAYSDNSGTLASLSLDASSIVFRPGGTTKATLDSSGNLGLGVTPVATTNSTSFQFGSRGNLFYLNFGDGYTSLGHNWKYAYGDAYIANGAASLFTQYDGNFYWYNASNNTSGPNVPIGGAAALRMTLDASGRLMVNTTTPYAILTAKGSPSEVSLCLDTNAGNYVIQDFKINGVQKANIFVEPSAGSFNFQTTTAASINFNTNNTLRATLSASGNLGLGVTPNPYGATYRAIEIGPSGSYTVVTGSSNGDGGADSFGASILGNNSYDFPNNKAVGTGASSIYLQSGGRHRWYTAQSANAGTLQSFINTMTLDASGNLLVNTTSSPYPSKVAVIGNDSTPDCFVARNSNASAGKYWRIAYLNNSNTYHILNQSGSGVYLTDGSTSWSSTSDERLKEIVEPITNAISKVAALRSVIGRFKTDSSDKRRSFLIAQDVQSVLPEAVDASDPDRLGVAYTDLIPLLVAAIKELSAELQALKNA